MEEVKIGSVALGGTDVKVCVPLAPRGSSELFAELDFAGGAACDIAEWRADFWEEEAWRLELIKEGLMGKPLVFTYRTKKEGGLGVDDDEAYRLVYKRAILSGLVEAADIEFTKPDAIKREIIRAARENGVIVILSLHVFCGEVKREELIERLVTMQEAGGDIVKLAVLVRGENEAQEVISAGKEMYEKYAKRPFITVGMGEAGRITRKKSPFYGSAVTYALGLSGTGPGQMPVSELV